ncbi:hypothetical protein [Brevundimonas sp. EYE_349]|uniref:hypothetical protein n=1 Tax=Brevundimonas sp. EYE_349 TaxID=2853455 RepID=UPI002003C929|nr:hypothetical protein [Brevundimonas sp. EYE_349]MCK6103329.1 hypothetical protein [Brevundimonas sp. EYE_349]
MEYYSYDLSPDDSLITLQAADIILATSLHGREWTARVGNRERHRERHTEKLIS